VGSDQSETDLFTNVLVLECYGGRSIGSAHYGRAALVRDRIKREREYSQDWLCHENPLGGDDAGLFALKLVGSGELAAEEFDEAA
jgi:hypothetical protein